MPARRPHTDTVVAFLVARSLTMTTPRFSVVIAAYNAERTLEETLASVLAQTDSDFEIVVIDDGSNDRTLPIALRHASLDPRIQVASQGNQGVSAARNLGIAKARGELVAFLDADDIWHCEKLARHAELHDADPLVEASYARVAFCPDRSGALKAGSRKSSVPNRDCTLEDVIIENVVCTMSNLVLSRETLVSLGGFNRSMRHVEDRDLLARLVGNGHLLRGIPEILTGYRMNPRGLSCDFTAMLAGWKELASRWADRIDMRRGEALYCRHLARRVLRSGAGGALARDFVRRGVSRDHHAFLSGETLSGRAPSAAAA